jgi:hypothetical protein
VFFGEVSNDIWTLESAFILEGGVYVSYGAPCGGSQWPLLEAGENTQNVNLKWDDINTDIPQPGETVRATCRMKLRGFGFFDAGGGIYGYDCQPSPSL